MGITLCLEDSFKLRQATHIAVYEARWQQRAIDNFPRRPLTVSHSPPRGSYLGCQLFIRTTHCVYPVIAECRRILKSRGFIHTHPVIQNFVSRGISFSGLRRPKKSTRSVDRLRSQV